MVHSKQTRAYHTFDRAKKFAKTLCASRSWWRGGALLLALLPLLFPLSHAEAQTASSQPNGFGTEQYKPSRKRSRPNILVIVADDMGSADIGPYGGEVSTPNLDALAKNGITFSNFRTHASCSPSRSMLLSGVDNHLNGFGTMAGRLTGPPAAPQVGKPGYEGFLNNRVVTVASVMRDAGYHTYLAGKWHMGNRDGFRPPQRGFEESYALIGGGFFHYWWPEAVAAIAKLPPNEDTAFDFRENDVPLAALPTDFYSSKTYTDKMIEYIDKHRRRDDKPFFGYLSYTAPHSPLQAPEEYIAKYIDRYKAGWDELRKERFARQKALGLVPRDMELPRLRGNDPAFVSWASLSPEQQAIDARKMAVYAAMIDYMDMSIGRLIAHLKRIGEYENTLIVFMSDNGPEANNLSAVFEPVFHQAGIPIDNSVNNLGKFSSYISPAPGFALASDLPSFGAKASVTEGGVRNNFIVSYPAEIKSNRRTTAFATVLDIMPTLLSYARTQYPYFYNGQVLHPLDGSSMRQLWEGETASVHSPNEPIGLELFGTVNKALFQGNWKLLCQGDAPWGAGRAETWKLFNLNNDRNEAIDLSLYYPERLNQMVSLYQQYQTRVGYVSATTGLNTCGIRTAAGVEFERPVTLRDTGGRRLRTSNALEEMLGRPLTLLDLFRDDF